jgi:CheY-like chemotaxis protein
VNWLAVAGQRTANLGSLERLGRCPVTAGRGGPRLVVPIAPEQTILLVEDDEQLRRLISLALRLEGFVTREARDGLEALAILEWSRFNGVVIDLALPYLDGVSVLQEIATHAWAQSIAVVIVTGTDLPLTHVRHDCVLRKPVTPDQVVEAVKRCLAEIPS